jgi:hypothetical protein
MPRLAAVCGTTTEDSDLDPAALAVAVEYLEWKRVPRRPEWTPSLLSTDLGGDRRTWQRHCENGDICAVRRGRGYVVIWPWLVRYFAGRVNLFSAN